MPEPTHEDRSTIWQGEPEAAQPTCRCQAGRRTSRYRRQLQMARIATVAACSPMLVSATGTSSRTCSQGLGSAPQLQHLH